MRRRCCLVALGGLLAACGAATQPAPVATAGGSADGTEQADAEDPRLTLARGFVRAWQAGDDGALAALAPPEGLWVWLEDGTFATPAIHISAAGCAESGGAPVPCASHPRAARIDPGVGALEAALENVHHDEPLPRYPEAEHPRRPPWATLNSNAQRFIDYLGYLDEDPRFGTADDVDSELFAIGGSDEVHIVMGVHDGAPRIQHVLIMQSEAG